MILSVVIVSYNVRFFLEQCLSSLRKAVAFSDLLRGNTEVFVVDNASSDGGIDFLLPLFPAFRFIHNAENLGFAKANNQALTHCSGEFVLFLNPDTILTEDCLDKCLSFFRSKSNAGALGVHMVDGSGRFLKESKRGFPGPGPSFFKMTGIAGWFPRSKIFSSYYHGNLEEGSSHAVDILSGAFLLVKKSILDQIGGFDEQFFMYAEDIDLSYRINQRGFQNYYFAGTTIIHFKGESTRKDVRYTKMFYTAMVLFMKKYFRGPGLSIPLFFLTLGVRFRQTFVSIPALFRKSKRVAKSENAFFVRGEPDIQKKWSQKLAGFNIAITEMQGEAREIIFCESPNQPWKSIIQEIAKNPGRCVYYFHGSGTHAAVSSYSNKQQGHVIEL